MVVEAIERGLQHYQSLEDFVAWARTSGAIAEVYPVQDAACGGPRPSVLYVEPGPALMAIEGGPFDSLEVQRRAWDEVMTRPGKTLEGADSLMLEACRAAPGTPARQVARKKETRDGAARKMVNRHVSFSPEVRPGPVAEIVDAVMRGGVMCGWLSARGCPVRAKQSHLYYGDFRHLADHTDMAGTTPKSSNVLLQLGGPSMMRLQTMTVSRTMGSALALSGQARCTIRHGLEGDENEGSMSLIYSVPDEFVAEISVALSAICTLASAIVLHVDPSMTGSERWDAEVMLGWYDDLEPYQLDMFRGVPQRVAGAAGGREFQRRFDENPEKYRHIRAAGGRAARSIHGGLSGRFAVESGALARARGKALRMRLDESPMEHCWLALQEVHGATKERDLGYMFVAYFSHTFPKHPGN